MISDNPNENRDFVKESETKKITPIEKAGISGVASGATIEGLSALMGADSIEKKYFTRYGFSEGGKEWGEISFEWMPTVNEWMPYNEDDPLSKNDLELFRKEKEYELVNEMLKNEKSRLHTFYINNPYHVDEEEFDTKYEVLNEDGEIENLGLLISWDEPEIEYRKSQYSTDPETPLYRFEFLDAEEQSAYWFLKTEIANRAPLTEMDLSQILEMLQNVPAKEMNEAMEEAEMMGDEAAMIVLVMADNKRKFREEYASEEEESRKDKLKGYFEYMRERKPEVAQAVEFALKNEDEIPEKLIWDNGYNPDIIEEWVDLVGIEDENLQPYESCPTCEGEGIIVTHYYPATRFDPADIDYIDCEECIDGEYDPAFYMDKEGQYYAESFEAEDYYWTDNEDDGEVWSEHESGWAVVVGNNGDIYIEDPYNAIIEGGFSSMEDAKNAVEKILNTFEAENHADRQLEESIKRTKMSAIRTGLAITTFGIVMLNLWTNRKQSQQIDKLNRKD